MRQEFTWKIIESLYSDLEIMVDIFRWILATTTMTKKTTSPIRNPMDHVVT